VAGGWPEGGRRVAGGWPEGGQRVARGWPEGGRREGGQRVVRGWPEGGLRVARVAGDQDTNLPKSQRDKQQREKCKL
jgi:hypothetical protein